MAAGRSSGLVVIGSDGASSAWFELENIMPCFSESDVRVKMRRLIEAKRRVRCKFPKLIEGSSGWFRAVAHQMKKVGDINVGC
jgi:hypothetical protein